MVRILQTGDENADQTLSLPVPERASPLVVRAIDPSAPGGLFVNLATTLFVDPETTVALADQTGNIQRPFATLQQAVDAASSGDSILITPAVAGAGNAALGSKSLSFIGLAVGASGAAAATQANVGELSYTAGAPDILIQNLTVAAILAPGGTNTAAVELRSTVVLGEIECAELVSYDSQHGDDIAAGTSARFLNGTFSAIAITSGAAVEADGMSFFRMRAAGVAVTPFPSLIDTDAYIMNWGCLTLGVAAAPNLIPWSKQAVSEATTSNKWIAARRGGTLRNMYVRMRDAHTQAVTFTIQQNFAASAMALTIGVGNTIGTNDTPVAVAVNDFIGAKAIAADNLAVPTAMEVTLQLQ